MQRIVDESDVFSYIINLKDPKKIKNVQVISKRLLIKELSTKKLGSFSFGIEVFT